MIAFSGTVWRILNAAQADAPLAPARAPTGRFHHSGQTAIYTSLTAEGAGVAIARYVAETDVPRVIVPLRLSAPCLVDLRGHAEASIVWQDLPPPSPTWQFSDDARARGAQGLLYSSRSRPELTHCVIFAPNTLSLAGDPAPWSARVDLPRA